MSAMRENPYKSPAVLEEAKPKKLWPIWDAALMMMASALLASSIVAALAEDGSRVHRSAGAVMQWSSIAFPVSFSATSLIRRWMGTHA